MNSDDRISAFLDGELSATEADAFGAEAEANPGLAAELESFAAIRGLLRSGGQVAPRAGAIERIVAEVSGTNSELAPVVDISTRRRVPTFAAVAASFAIIASIVGGLGGSTTLPALGDLVARHSAAAAAESMPPSDDDVMHEAIAQGPGVPGGFEIAHASREGSVTHLVFAGPEGSMVSVFRQEGDTDVGMVGDEMGKGEVSDMGGHPMWTGSIGDNHVAVLEGDGYLWTVVGDADHDTMAVMMTDLPTRSSGLSERLRDAAEVVVDPFRLGW